MTFSGMFPVYFQYTYYVFYKRKIRLFDYSLWYVYRLIPELFCVLYQLQH